MHSFNASKDLFISAPSNLVYLLELTTSAPLSLPARSMNDILPCVLLLTFNYSCKIACDLEEFIFAPVVPLIRIAEPS